MLDASILPTLILLIKMIYLELIVKQVSKIKKLNPEKRNGLISRINETDETDFIFIEKELINLKFEDLSEGMEVRFEARDKFANKIESLASLSSQETIEKSKIKFLNKDKRNGFIAKLHENDEKDFFFVERELIDFKFEDLEVGMTVQFKPNGLFANKVHILMEQKATQSESHQNYCIEQPNKPVEKNFSSIIQSIIYVMKSNAESINDPFIFEDYAHTILKMLVPEVYTSPRDKQAGLFDGLFKYKNLEVIYDCTLSKNFKEYKENQIANYINQIQQQSITINKERIGLSSNSTKQIWVITKDKTALFQTHRGTTDIRIKEVSIFSLIDLLNKKLANIDYDPLDAIDDLKDIK